MSIAKQQYYMDFYIKRKDAPELSQMTPMTMRVALSGIHHILRNEHRYNVGVAFPKWVDAGVNGPIPELGDVIRVVSNDYDALYSMRGNAWFTCQILAGDISVSKINPVPQGAQQVCFVRSRDAEMAKRDLERSTGKDVNIHDINTTSDDPCARTRFMTPNKQINMLIKKIAVAEAIPGDFSSYGLCCKENMVSVPDF